MTLIINSETGKKLSANVILTPFTLSKITVKRLPSRSRSLTSLLFLVGIMGEDEIFSREELLLNF